jgi:hypothetical protein
MEAYCDTVTIQEQVFCFVGTQANLSVPWDQRELVSSNGNQWSDLQLTPSTTPYGPNGVLEEAVEATPPFKPMIFSRALDTQ